MAASSDTRELHIEQLLLTRLWIARIGESDVQGWWRSTGMLGSDGAFVGPRVLPITHGAGRARIVFAVAAHACSERYPDPKASHLFKLDARTEDQLDALLVRTLDDRAFWSEVMAALEAVGPRTAPEELLRNAGVITDEDIRYAQQLKLGPDRRSVPVGLARSADETIRRLAAGFLRSSRGELAVPYLVGWDQAWR